MYRTLKYAARKDSYGSHENAMYTFKITKSFSQVDRSRSHVHTRRFFFKFTLLFRIPVCSDAPGSPTPESLHVSEVIDSRYAMSREHIGKRQNLCENNFGSLKT